MDISQLRTTRQFALVQRTACTFIPGLGYVRLGDLPFPAKPINPPSACTPPKDTPDMTLFGFIRPGGDKPTVMLHWLAELGLWQPVSINAGNRMAYRPAYLAAHGWKLANG